MNWKEVCELPTIHIEGIEVPRVLIGSSPFIGAGQFGPRSASYYQKFSNPENIATLLITAADLGLPAIHVIPYPNVVEGIQIAEKETDITFYKVGSTLPETNASLAVLQQLGTELVFIHGSVTDQMHLETLQNIEQQIFIQNMAPGLAIHNTIPVLEWVRTHREKLASNTLLVPLNRTGTFVGNIKQALALLTELDMNVFAMKTFAAGILSPDEAFQFVFETDVVQVVTFGVASTTEVQHSITVAKTILQ